MGKYGEPWEVREVDGLLAIAKQDGWVMENDDPAQDRAEADRKCACVNACASMPDPAKGVALAIRALRGLLEVDGDRCHFDHHGYCQSHNLGERDGPDECHVSLARKALAACGEEVGGV